MPPLHKKVPIRPLRRRVIFTRPTMASPSSSQPADAPTSQLETLLDTSLRFEELSSTAPSTTSSPAPSYYPYNPTNPYVPPAPPMPPAPALFSNPPLLHDNYTTATSLDQDHTVTSCLRYLSYPEDPFPMLDRTAHVAFLESGLDGGEGGKLPSYMVALDASRAWIIYWCIAGLAALGVDVHARYRTRVVDTLRTMQNPSGGFGGGNGQMSHLTASYSAVLALAVVSGEDSEEEPLGIIDRLGMLRFLHCLKDKSTGGFRVALNGESDVRGVYCALTIITLLRLPTAGLLDGTRDYLRRCQTYEGGFGATPGGNEAHGGYAFCALASLCMFGDPAVVLRETLDMDAFVRWLSARQYAPEGGLSGRTNKLVDGCYSTWVGGCWALVEAGINGPQNEVRVVEAGKEVVVPENRGVVGSLWNREGLARYILTCCQSRKGGLRDKPGKGPDFYHSCYILLGLSSTQHYFYYVPPETTSTNPPAPSSVSSADSFNTAPTEATPVDISTDTELPLTAAFQWRYTTQIPSVVKGLSEPVVEDLPTWPDDVAEEDVVSDRLDAHHPIFNVPFRTVPVVEAWLKGKVGF